MKSYHKCRILILAFVLSLTAPGCKSGVDGVSTNDSKGDTVTLSFGTVSNPTTLALGESLTFSVYYQGEKLEISGCRAENSDGGALGDKGGTTSVTTTECTYTAPNEMPVEASVNKATATFDLNVVVEIADADPVLEATLGIVLSGNAEEQGCMTYEDCDGTELCHFGTCVEPSVVGVVAGITCGEGNDDCDEGYACLPFNSEAGCNYYCVLASAFWNGAAGDPLTEGACDALTEPVASWYDEAGLCLTSDTAVCVNDDGDDDDGDDDGPAVLPVVSTSPADGATNVLVNAVITITFDRAMDVSTLTADHFYVTTGNFTIQYPCVVSYDAETFVWTCTPTESFESGVIITVVNSDIRSAEGIFYGPKQWGFGVANETCGNDIDDDGNGVVDRDEPSCQSLLQYNEGSQGDHCEDGIDDDNDGLTDCRDPDCQSNFKCEETINTWNFNLDDPPEVRWALCLDGFDDDGDGDIDCADDGCVGAPGCL